METFLTLALSFPTALFTTLLLAMFFYWALVLMGAFGIELDGDGVLEAKSGVLEALGFGVVPGSVVVTFLIFWAWAVSLAGAHWLGPLAGGFLPLGIWGSAVALGALFVSLFLSAYSVKPLKPLFAIKVAPERRQLLGKLATVSSGRVDGRFGQATLEDGGAGFILPISCDRVNTLKKGDRVVLVGYDEKGESYEVEPVEWLLPEELGSPEERLAREALARSELEPKRER